MQHPQSKLARKQVSRSPKVRLTKNVEDLTEDAAIKDTGEVIIKAKVDARTAQNMKDLEALANGEASPEEFSAEDRQNILNFKLVQPPKIIADFMLNAEFHYKVLKLNESIFAAQSALRSEASTEIARRTAVEEGKIRAPASEGPNEKPMTPVAVAVLYDESLKYSSFEAVKEYVENEIGDRTNRPVYFTVQKLKKIESDDGDKYKSQFKSDFVYSYTKKGLRLIGESAIRLDE